MRPRERDERRVRGGGVVRQRDVEGERHETVNNGGVDQKVKKKLCGLSYFGFVVEKGKNMKFIWLLIF